MCVLSNGEIDRDFCAIVFCKGRQRKTSKVVLMDRSLNVIKEDWCPEYYDTWLFETINKKVEYHTNKT